MKRRIETGAPAVRLMIQPPGRRKKRDATTGSYQDLLPSIDNTYYVGRNDDDNPLAWKGVILKDIANGKYYRIEVENGNVTTEELTD